MDIFMEKLLKEIRSCTICQDFLPNLPKPIIRASEQSKILIIGQAPGQKVQNSGIPWDDLSGKELRRWLGVMP
jgi:uracil-DNA glycosylase